MAEEKDLLSPSFKRAVDEANYFYDWFLKDLYIANTGKMLLETSKRGYTTVQLEFCTSSYNMSYVVIFINVTDIKITMEKNDKAVSTYAFTNFGRCIDYEIKHGPTHTMHEIYFEGQSKITIISQKVKCKKIVNYFFDKP